MYPSGNQTICLRELQENKSIHSEENPQGSTMDSLNKHCYEYKSQDGDNHVTHCLVVMWSLQVLARSSLL